LPRSGEGATAAQQAGHADGLTGETMHNALPTHPHLLHPKTGKPLTAVFVSEKTGRVYWPILGAEDPPEPPPAPPEPPAYTPPASQADLDRIVQDRLARERAKYGMTPEEAKAAKDRADQLEHDLASDSEKAVAEARKDERAKANSEATPRVVRAEFKAAAKGVLSGDQLTALLEDLDLSKYVTDTGDVDEEKVSKKVAAFAPAGNNGRPPRPLGQGTRPPSETKPGDAGRAMAEKRFGSKS
jgi:hypothetical protein